ncbi:MAG: OmpA family protein [Flavobacteriaceae bacterium]|nr:OmpA family protein [Flavobacteriaceae bacterium]
MKHLKNVHKHLNTTSMMSKKITLIAFLLCWGLMHSQDDNFSIKNLDVNTKNSDFGVTYIGDTVAIYASTKKGKRTIRKRNWKQNKQPYLELYSGNISSDGEINDSELFSSAINTRYHESNVTFTKDLKTVYFSRDNSIDGKKRVKATEGKDKGWMLIQLYKATVAENGEWTNIVPMPFNNDNYQTGHPSLNKAEDKLYFTSDMPGGYGMTDIYVVTVNGDGTYGEPRNLGSKINTPSKEMFPFISEDDVLYFSSDGQLFSHGGLDLYASRLGDRYKDDSPTHLGIPLNSAKDDFALVYQSGKSTGHFSSNREGGKGDDDIYFFERLKPIFKDKGCNQIAQGVVRDKKSGALLPKTLVTLYKEGKKEESVIVGSDASFQFTVDCESNYKVVGEKLTYTPDEETFLTSLKADLELDLSLNLEDAEEFVTVGDKVLIKINPIYFDYDKSNIRPDAEIELNTVITVMNKYPNLIIEGGSHTDSRATYSYNEKLSSRRAKSTVDYIMRVGKINWSRISARGYGEIQPVNKCSDNVKCTEEEHQLNRRTEFVIKNPEVINK